MTERNQSREQRKNDRKESSTRLKLERAEQETKMKPSGTFFGLRDQNGVINALCYTAKHFSMRTLGS